MPRFKKGKTNAERNTGYSSTRAFDASLRDGTLGPPPHGVCEILDAVLQLLPLDTYVEKPVSIMQKVPGDTVATPIWDEFEQIVQKHEERKNVIGSVERFAFYEEAKSCYVIIATSEKALYGNIMLQKGVV